MKLALCTRVGVPRSMLMPHRAAMAAAFAYLRSKGAFPEDNDDDSDDMIFGDDAE